MPRSSVNVAGPVDDLGRVSVRLRQPGMRSPARATSASIPASDGAADEPPVGVPAAIADVARGAPPAALPVGIAGAEVGGRSPNAPYTSRLAQPKEMITPDATITTSGAQHQSPMTLCQLKS